MTKTAVAAICLLVVALPACDVLNPDCTNDGERWCDGRDVKTCVHELEDGEIVGSYSISVADTCAVTERCVEWLDRTEGRDATCIEAGACAVSESFCIDETVAASCPEGQDVPEIDACGDESFEGGRCNVSSSGTAVCAFDDLPCAPEGAQKCLGGGSRYAMVCTDGEWSELYPCLVGESCYDLTGGGIECKLRMRGWQ
jgi:hypothetical protein